MALVTSTACSVAGSVVKAPVQERCEEIPLKGCSQMAEGVVLFVEGNQAAGREKLRAGAAQNAPEDVRTFAHAIVLISRIPAVGQYAAPIASVAQLLETEASASGPVAASPAASGVAAGPAAGAVRSTPRAVAARDAVSPSVDDRVEHDRTDFAVYALTAPLDPSRTETESLAFSEISGADTGSLGGMSGTCVARRAGAIVIADLLALNGCPGRLFVGASLSDKGPLGLRWFAEANASGLTGARLFVGGGEWLQLIFVPNAKADPHDARCVITWSGFRPRIVPGKT
jgi:hypothetical protein